MADMDIHPPAGSRKPKRIAGRGNSGRRGGKAGKGDKGQNSRSGGGVRPGFEGGQMPLYRRLPRKGFTNSRFKHEYVVVNVGTLDKKFADGETVTLETLAAKKAIKRSDSQVKILGDGELGKKLTVAIDNVSGTAKEKIEKAGGTVEGASPDAGSEQKSEKIAEKTAESAAKADENQQEGSVDGE